MEHQTIVHLSDLHLSKRGKPEATHFKRLTAFIQKKYPGCPVLITGDVTDSATRSQMKLSRKLLGERLNYVQLRKIPALNAVSGNDDRQEDSFDCLWESFAEAEGF